MPEASRPLKIEWLDIAKGIAILVVAFGHVVALPQAAGVAPAAMPMFFFLSGYVFKARPFDEFVWKRGFSLLVPFCSYIVVITLLWLVLAIFSDDLVTIYNNPDKETLFQTLKASHFHWNYAPLWFLPALFLAQLIYNCLINWLGSPSNYKMIAWVMFSVAIGCIMALDERIAWLGIAPVAVLFIWGGNIYRSINLPCWTFVLALLLTAAVLYLSSPFNMRLADYGIPGFTLIAALASCHVVVVGCQLLTRILWIATIFMRLGTASLVIMALHVTFAMRMTYSWHLPWYVVFPGCICLSYVSAALFQRSGWIAQWLLLGHTPAPARFSLAQDILGRFGLTRPT